MISKLKNSCVPTRSKRRRMPEATPILMESKMRMEQVQPKIASLKNSFSRIMAIS